MAPTSWKRAIVVGASSGIGAAIARRLAKTGCQVALVARRGHRLRELADSIVDDGGQGWPVPHDVRQFGEIAPLFDQVIAQLGGLDLLVYASGTMPTIDEHEYAFVKDREMVEVNLLGAMGWMNPAAAHMEAERSGTLVGISSIAGIRGRRGNPAYCASKAGLTTYLESLRNRLDRYGVNVTCAKPGFVATAMTEGMGNLLWMIEADDAAKRILRLARGRGREGFVPRRWWMVAAVIRWIPSFLFRRMNI